MTETIAIIPARSGSKSVKDKNLANLCGYPLIAYSIVAAKLSTVVERVVVSTDSDDYKQVSEYFGAEVPFLRPQKFAQDNSTDRGFLLHAMEWMKEMEGNVPEYWVHLRPTTPLREPVLIDNAVEKIRAERRATSLRSGHKSPENPLKWFTKDTHSFYQPILKDDGSERYNQPKEAFPQVYVPNGYVDVVLASQIMRSETTHGNQILSFDTPVSCEVDSPDELDYLRYQLQKDGSVLLTYLKENFPIYYKEQN
ncbi:acylneuraminate cytidylyltransferase family protein [Aestuariibacter sp. AA17]|uniref:Acylneuraminate cytidylyltransferase family protein n=1 Tax=Fluctibacter corallii TaxID=2984329 RepID=A0ABT3A9U1_9ALTE|nr:acylneuraminate cytidylyltransferase family protein [Aestuariibacter sp. AA17]MCV2885441.1 acylneuraminate cytidylyltransferase family protein [Aestuariibacter sp. AA17]